MIKYKFILLQFFTIFMSFFMLCGHTAPLTTQNKYNGIIEHLTFETLLSCPEKTLDDNNLQSNKFDTTKITPNEFKNILNELYKNNYILIDIFDIVFIENNTIYSKPLYLPHNKKPILLSFNNVTYKSNYQNTGGIDKIIIDRNNKFATYTTKKDIQDRIMHDNEFIPIMESFIDEHPDFSFNSARGIIMFTGENGILGYDTNSKKPNSRRDIKRVTEVIHKLKSSGWTFGCNNYKYEQDETITDLEFAKLINLWQKEIKPIIGLTYIYSPLSGTIDFNNKNKKDILIDNDFKIFFINDFKTEFKLENNSLIMSRKPINGHTLRNNTEEFSHLFDCEQVYDHTIRNIPFTQLTQ